MQLNKFISIAALAGAAMMVTPVSAEPIDDFMTRLNQYLSSAGGSVSYLIGPGYADTNRGLAPLALSTPNGESIPLGTNAYIDKVTTLPGDILLASGLHISDFSRTFAGVTGGARSVIVDLALPPVGTSDPLILAQAVKGVSVFGLHIEEGGVSLDIDAISYFLFVTPELGSPDPTNLTFSVSMEGLALTEAILEELGNPEPLTLLVGQKVDLDFSLDWKRDANQISPVRIEVGVPDFGDIAFSVGLGGITDEVIVQLVALGQQLSATGSTPELQQQAIPLLSQLTILEVFSGVFNEGGGEAVLALAAEEAGSGKASVIMSGSRDLRQALTDIGLPEMGATIGDAFATMILAEGGLVISGYPETPVSIFEAIALGSSAPKALVDRLDLEARYDPPAP